MYRLSVLIILAGLSVGLWSSCNRDSESPVEGDLVMLGALLPLSGAGASPGESALAGLELALQEVEDYFSRIQRDVIVEMLIEDTGTDVEQAQAAYERLRSEGVRLIIGPYSSSVLAALKPLADRDGIVLLSPGSVASSLAVEGDQVFRLLPDVVSQGEALAALIRDDGIRVLLPVVRDDIWGVELLAATSLGLTGSDIEIADNLAYNPANLEVESFMVEVVASVEGLLADYSPEEIGVYMLSYGEGYDVLRAAQEFMIPDVRWYGSSAFAESSTMLSDTAVSRFAEANGLACPSFGLDPNARAKWEPLREKLESKLGRRPEVFAFTSYDAVWLAVHVLLDVGKRWEETGKALEQRAGLSHGSTGWLGLNAFGDRLWAFYEFWGVRVDGETVQWEVLATYNNETGELERD